MNLRPPRFWTALQRFWQRDESLSVLLALLVLFAFVLPPFVPHRGASSPVAAGLFSCLLVAGVATVMRQKRWVVAIVAVAVLLALPLRWAAWVGPGDAFTRWSVASETFALVTLALVVLNMVLRPGTITRYRIEGAVAAYILLGLAWSGAYQLVWLSDPAAFAGTVSDSSRQWIYLSFVTLTSTGYGDITPLHPVARSLAVAEALTGQLYIAILISRLVALELQSRPEKK